MKTVNIKKLIKNEDTDQIAKLLFPNNRYPGLALGRVLKGKSELNTIQVSRLASVLGLEIHELFSVDSWTAERKFNFHIFKRDGYTAKLNTCSWLTSIYKDDSLFHESVLSKKTVPLSEYISEINLIINKFESNEKN